LTASVHSPDAYDFRFVALLIFVSQIVCIALPALMLTLFLTARPMKTLLLDRPPQAAACAAAVLLAAALHPVGQQLLTWIMRLYPVQEEAVAEFTSLFEAIPNFWWKVLLIAGLPAICEELAFRGFVLSGLRHVGNKWWAISLSAVFFGFTHPVIQQSLAATAVGVVIGYLAVQSGSLIPCILFHLVYNGLMLTSERLPEWVEAWPALRSLVHEPAPGQYAYAWYVVAAGAVAAAALLAWFHRLPYQATKEEQLSDARARQEPHALEHV
jgi:sodium transport system permease protein